MRESVSAIPSPWGVHLRSHPLRGERILYAGRDADTSLDRLPLWQLALLLEVEPG